MILMIDNYDSFTYNIVQYCLELGADLKIIRNDELTLKEIEALNPQKIIISPGPATPNDAGVCLDVIKYFAGKKPIFGICLGHQAIGQVFGGNVVRAKNMMHGKTSLIKVVKDTKIFEEKRSHYSIFGKQLDKESEWDYGWWQHKIPGGGSIDWQKIYQTLREIGYDGYVSIEHEDLNYSENDDAIKLGLMKGKAFLDSIFKK